MTNPIPDRRGEILDTARQLVLGDRERDYGGPDDTLQTAAELWQAYLDRPIVPYDVAVLMALLKIARIKHRPEKLDNWIDLAGYAALGGNDATAFQAIGGDADD